MDLSKKQKQLSKALIWLSAFIGLGAYWGSIMFFIDPTGKIWGMDLILPYMQSLPFADILFTDFLLSGIMLIMVNGIWNTVSVIGLLKNKRWGVIFGLISGILLFGWLGVQWLIFTIIPLTSIYTLLSIIQIIISIRLWRALPK